MKKILFALLLRLSLCIQLCSKYPILKDLIISTNYIENSYTFNYTIVKNCEVDGFWEFKREKASAMEVYDGSNINRRIFRFELANSEYNDILKVNIVSSFKSINNTIPFEDKEFYLKGGEIFDVFCSYENKRLNEYNIKNGFYKIIFDIGINREHFVKFELIKLLSNNNNESDDIDVTIIFMIVICISIIITAVNETIYSNYEESFLGKFPEIRNTENLLVISLIFIMMFVFFNTIEQMSLLITLSLLIAFPLSFSVLCEYFFYFAPIKEQINQYPIFKKILCFNLSLQFFISMIIGVIILFLWELTSHWVFCDIISICLILVTIRLFRFTSFKFIFFFSLLSWVYDLYWVFKYVTPFKSYYRYTFKELYRYPVYIKLPDLYFKYYNEYLYLSASDIVLPGILIIYLKKFDKRVHFFKTIYLLYSIIGFSIGLFAQLLIYYYFFISIPAYLIIYPLILIPCLIFAFFKGELKEMSQGFNSTIFAESELESNKLNQIANQAYGESIYSISSSLEMKYFS